MPEAFVGIDIGTDNIRAAVYSDGYVQIISDSTGALSSKDYFVL